MRRLVGSAVAILAAGAALTGCSAPPAESGEDLKARAEFLVLEEQWAEAISVLKEYLIRHPEDSGAHFYLGRCWLNVAEFNGREGPWLVLAEGELRLARQLFYAQGKRSTIKRFPDTYFDIICNIERAKVYLRQLTFVIDHPGQLAGATLESILASLQQAVDDAKAIDPAAPDVVNLENLLKSLTDDGPAPQPRAGAGTAI
ncbi:MAG TPA: hypothetical protein PLB67_20025 [Candidatus Hydrogenedentes bacterium]|jgi:hypothetical protein|nr:hypothetical protein [Candidatus Hydrogenedentota bacterium]MDY0031274.1 hypothetical protein [FCB group bacterium]NLT60634.1 hypothetical protein [Candidatus Hydrogenedentota bacterium]HNV20476.1 hypothetical protein [Candidatus Hydrogenedentota bacterium]HNZ17894.1 hypothetical protein [Candidatus Hydrogenedentota bacterium]